MSSSSFSKRQKERTRQDRQREKAAKRQQRGPQTDQRPKTDASGAVIDPDIADIIPGPQPQPEDG